MNIIDDLTLGLLASCPEIPVDCAPRLRAYIVQVILAAALDSHVVDAAREYFPDRRSGDTIHE